MSMKDIKFTPDMMLCEYNCDNVITTLKCDACGVKITYDQLLHKYGPEGLYIIAKKLM